LNDLTRELNTYSKDNYIRDAAYLGCSLEIIAPGGSPVTGEDQRHLSVLLVEDNEVNQKIVQAMLKRMGYRADLAVNGLEGLQALENKRYDVVLMDIQMPVMDGLQATEAIRARLPPAEQPYIIAITAYAHLYSVDMCLHAGMNDYIIKPFNLEELKIAFNGIRANS
jgi:CheY-like chemotaxis protein